MTESSVFTRILRGEIPAEIIAQTDNAFAIRARCAGCRNTPGMAAQRWVGKRADAFSSRCEGAAFAQRGDRVDRLNRSLPFARRSLLFVR